MRFRCPSCGTVTETVRGKANQRYDYTSDAAVHANDVAEAQRRARSDSHLPPYEEALEKLTENPTAKAVLQRVFGINVETAKRELEREGKQVHQVWEEAS